MDKEEDVPVSRIFQKEIHHLLHLTAGFELYDMPMSQALMQLDLLLKVLGVSAGKRAHVNFLHGIISIVVFIPDLYHFGKGSFTQDL